MNGLRLKWIYGNWNESFTKALRRWWRNGRRLELRTCNGTGCCLSAMSTSRQTTANIWRRNAENIKEMRIVEPTGLTEWKRCWWSNTCRVQGPIDSKFNCVKKLHEKLNSMFSDTAQVSHQVCQFFFLLVLCVLLCVWLWWIKTRLSFAVC